MAKTHVDHVPKWFPALFKAAEQRARALGRIEWPVRNDESPGADYLAAFKSDMFRIAERFLLEPQAAMLGCETAEDVLRGMERAGRLHSYAATYEPLFLNLVNHLAFGRKAFYFRRHLVERLALTDVNVDASFVVPPFRSSIFVYHDEFMHAALEAVHGTALPHYPVTVYVHEFQRQEGRSLTMYAFMTDGEAIPVALNRSLLLTETNDVESALRTTWPERPDYDRAPIEAIPDDACFFEGAGSLYARIVVNSILYLASADPRVSGALTAVQHFERETGGARNRRQRQALHQATVHASPAPYIDVGAGIDRIIVSRASTFGHVNAGKSGRTLHHRFTVRGHWRQQAHGPKHTLRRLLYIEPYEKGPDLADLLNRPYDVR